MKNTRSVYVLPTLFETYPSGRTVRARRVMERVEVHWRRRGLIRQRKHWRYSVCRLCLHCFYHYTEVRFPLEYESLEDRIPFSWLLKSPVREWEHSFSQRAMPVFTYGVQLTKSSEVAANTCSSPNTWSIFLDFLDHLFPLTTWVRNWGPDLHPKLKNLPSYALAKAGPCALSSLFRLPGSGYCQTRNVAVAIAYRSSRISHSAVTAIRGSWRPPGRSRFLFQYRYPDKIADIFPLEVNAVTRSGVYPRREVRSADTDTRFIFCPIQHDNLAVVQG